MCASHLYKSVPKFASYALPHTITTPESATRPPPCCTPPPVAFLVQFVGRDHSRLGFAPLSAADMLEAAPMRRLLLPVVPQ